MMRFTLARWAAPALVLTASIALPTLAHAAVARTNTFTGTSSSGSTTVSSVTIAAGEFALVQCGWRKTGAEETITGVTFNGSATGVSAVGSTQVDTIAGDGRQQTYQITGVTGTANVVVSYNTGPNAAGCIVRTFSGVDTGGTPLSAPTSNANDTDPITVNSASASAGDLVVDHVVYRGGHSLTAGAGQVGSSQTGTGGANVSTHASEETGTGAITMSWTTAGGANWSTLALVVKAGAGGGGSTRRRRMMMGIGR
jgi:hypothetical protein